MIAEQEHRATWFVAGCDICGRPYDAEPYDNRADLEHDLRVEGWHLNDLDTSEIVCPVCWPGRAERDDTARGLPGFTYRTAAHDRMINPTTTQGDTTS